MSGRPSVYVAKRVVGGLLAFYAAVEGLDLAIQSCRYLCAAELRAMAGKPVELQLILEEVA